MKHGVRHGEMRELWSKFRPSFGILVDLTLDIQLIFGQNAKINSRTSKERNNHEKNTKVLMLKP